MFGIPKCYSRNNVTRHKNTALSMALVITVAMVLGMMSMTAFASETTEPTAAPTSGSITINSPIVGATYDVYKVFDMTTNAAVDAFSYTIDENNPFYGAVVEYAGVADNGMTLSRIINSDPATYNVTVDESKFNAQDFGKAMQAVLDEGSPAVEADDAETATQGTGIVAKEAGSAISADYSEVCTITTANTSNQLVFDNDGDGIPLGYYLVNPTYPPAAAKSVTMGDQTFTIADFEVDDETGELVEPLELTDVAEGKIDAYVDATVTPEYVQKYITDHKITTNEDGSPLNDAGRTAIETALKNSMKEDAEKKILAAFNNENGEESDINVKEPILVFLDSSQPDAVINEKNELDKWDVPVNPSGEAPDGTPDHGEPEGGKNIVVSEDPQYFADWSEAEIGESVHYQLRVNAMNFIRTGETDDTVEQVKEYILADYQSAHMHFDADKGLRVSIWQGDNDNDSQADSKVNVTSDAGLTGIANASYNANGGDPYLDYTAYATGDPANTFFKNGTNADGTTASVDNDIFGTDGTGIVVPWVIVSEEDLSATYPIYTTTNVPIEGQYETEELKKDANNDPIPFKKDNGDGTWSAVPGQYISVNNHVVDAQGRLLDEEGNPIGKTKPVYTYSIYNSDVTIVVDYWMILDDDAIVDEPGNKNFAQYGWNPIDNEDAETGEPKTPTNPKDDDKPSQKEDVDEATVYTFALAWVKIDEQGKELAGAKFRLPFYVKSEKDGDAYVYGGTEAGEGLTNEVTTTADSAVITIKGVEQGTYSITETEAPEGFNKLTAPFTVEAKKSGPAVTTKTKTTVFLDAQGNVTNTVTNMTVEYITDEDSYNKETPAVTGEETSVPVYQFDPIVNKQGTELPSTGGIGTTIFYVVGAILVLGAGIVLITRRRMDG